MGKNQTGTTVRRNWRPYVLPLLAISFVSLTVLVGLQRLERMLIHDSRFVLRQGSLPGESSPDLRITGLNRATASQVRRVFEEDEGRSVYLLPLAERQNRLAAIPWIRQASVSRIWPNRVEVRVRERTPEAFIRLPGSRGSSKPMLIDGDGVILPVPEDRPRLELPALDGIREDQSQPDRAARVRLMKRVQEDLGAMAERVSEIDVRDTTSIRIIFQVGDRAVTLLLGNEDFGRRVAVFLQHFPEIVRRAPNATTFDLRLPDRITAVEEESNGE